MVGQSISHYTILEELGRGGMGIVFKAEDTKLNRTVALKVLLKQTVGSSDDLERFKREAQAAASLNHPHISTVHSIDEADDQAFIVMEFVDGPSLKDRMDEGRLDLKDALDLTIQFLSGLEAAHELGIVHRDIKPANIMLTQKGQAKIMDFGLAKLAGQATLTKTGMTVGTAAYMSPEQARGDRVDHQSDLFSAGAVLYEMLVGERAFKGEYDQAVIYSILNVDSEPVSALRDDLSPGLDEVLNRALAKDPGDRYESATAFMKDLRSVAGLDTELAQMAKASAKVPALRTRTGFGLAVSVFVLAAFIGGYLLFGRGSPGAQISLGRAQQLTYLAGMEIDPAISPDGEMIAFAAGALGQTKIYVRQFSGGRAISLTEGMPGAHRWPRWAPDGQNIAFEAGFSIFVTPALGGTPRKLLDVEPGSTGLSSAWSPDGTRIAYVEKNGIYIHSISQNESRLLTEAFLPHSLAWSPDGALIAYVSDNQRYVFGSLAFANVAPSSVWVARVSDGASIQATGIENLNISPVWTPDGRTVLFVSDRDGTPDIYSVGISSSGDLVGDVQRHTAGLNAHTIFLSQDGQKLSYSVFSLNQNIWSIPIPNNGPVSVSGAEPVTRGHQAIESMHVSGDAEWMVYDSDLAGNQDIYKMHLPDGEPIQLTTHPANDFTPSWSFDGTEVVFHSFRDGNREIYSIDSEGREPVRLTNQPSHERVAVFSPDGNHITFFSDATGTQELFMISRAGPEEDYGSPVQITTTGGLHSSWSPDGKTIAFITGSRQHMMSADNFALAMVSPEGGESSILVLSEDPAVVPQPEHVSWSSDGQTLYYTAFDEDLRGRIYSIPATGGEPELLVLFDDPTKPFIRHEFATDGSKFYFTLSEFESDLWVIDVEIE